MALRLTGTTLQPSSSAVASDPSTLTAEGLAAQARTLLSRGDVDGFAGLFELAASRPEPQRRYEARLALINAGVQATAAASEAVATRVFLAIADATLTMLDSEPAEPLILNLAGVTLYELWSLDAAQALFKAARRLDPALRDPQRNLDQVARRKREGGRRTRPLHASIPGLARRAHTVAKRARPATDLTLSLCMIVRDEEQMLPRCLAAAAPAVDEIVIVDTGSTDATIEIARSFGARVLEHEWTGSFSEARNISFTAATGDWLLYLDADEVLTAGDAPRLRALIGQTWREAFYLVETSYLGELGEGSAMVNNALRLFRNRPEYRFKDRLHEQIQHTLPTYVPGRVEQSGVRIQHYGYLGSVREAKEKSQRNLELLLAQADETAPTPFLHFNLGSEYAAAGQPAAAVDEFKQAQAMLEQDGGLLTCEYSPALMGRLVMALRICGQLAEARDTAAHALEQFPELTDLVLAQARIAQAMGDEAGAIRLYRRCAEMGDAPARYGAMVGSGTFLPRLYLAELHLGHGDTAAARAELEWCVEHHPEFLAVAGPYAAALLRDGVDPAAVLTELERLDTLPPMIRLAVAGAFQHAGARGAAATQFRLALDAVPTNTRARSSLAELLLAGGEWDEAAHHAHLVPVDDPYAGLACRIELCSLIGHGNSDSVPAALARAATAGLPPAELQVFEAWAAIADGAPVPDGLPVSGAPLLAVLLDTLLGAGDLDSFRALRPALQRSRLARREQQELLAEMFLARGMLAAAAQEWMAASSPQPDVRSLVGLARVAERHGMTEDAVNFATAALELDPESVAAGELLAHLPALAASAVSA
jgi:tetratricopeptide (TPR) repeat protein